MNRYYLSYSVRPSELKEIIKRGYLKHDKYVDFLLFSGETMPKFFPEITLFFDMRLLYKHKFEYITPLFRTNVDPRLIDVYTFLQSMNYEKLNQNEIYAQDRIFLKNKVSLKKYLIAICCEILIPPKLVTKIKKKYPHVQVLMRAPKDANDIHYYLALIN
jgi:hypothetical protein